MTRRVCILTSVHNPFDTRVFHREAAAARNDGYDVVLIAPGAPAGKRDGITLQGLPTWGGRAGRPLRWPILFWKALRARADIYHGHDPELLPWLLLLRWVTRKPVVYDSHEYLREDILAKYWLPSLIRGPVAAIAAFTELFVARRISAVVAVTDDMAERFRAVQPKTVTIRNLPPAAAESSLGPVRDPVAIYSGLMNAERGLTILHATGAALRRLHPTAEIHVLGPVEWFGMPESEKNRSESAWLEAGVRFLGTVPQPEVEPILGRAAVGWLPRDPQTENNLMAWPHKLVEYMTVALPVVASDLPRQAAIIREADAGIVVEPPLSADAHAAAIAALLADPERARRLGQNGRQAALASYTWEGEAMKLHTLYRELAP